MFFLINKALGLGQKTKPASSAGDFLLDVICQSPLSIT